MSLLPSSQRFMSRALPKRLEGSDQLRAKLEEKTCEPIIDAD